LSEQDLQNTAQLTVPNERLLTLLFGPSDAHRRVLERRLKVKLYARGTQISLHGASRSVEKAQRVLQQLLSEIEGGRALFLQEVERVTSHFESLDAPPPEEDAFLAGDPVSAPPPPATPPGGAALPLRTYDQRTIQGKTPNQRRYIDEIHRHDVVFGVGPAGTGKTYLAVACAVSALRRHEVKRIVLTRPAVEAGEKLGFLPGSLVEKVNPYLRPLYDALFEMMGTEQANKAIEERVIEVAPLAFMRGRTLNQAFVILDEAQNTTPEQMKMFLTRLGYSSKAVVTGDVTQTDLPRHQMSGLGHALRILEGVEGISQVHLTTADVVRHPLVRAIIKAYEGDGAY